LKIFSIFAISTLIIHLLWMNIWSHENLLTTMWHLHGNISTVTALLSDSSVRFTESGRVRDGSRRPGSCAAINSLLGPRPRKFVGAMCNAGVVVTIVNHVQKRTRDRHNGGDGAIFGPTRISGPAKQSAPKCGACPTRLHGARATWQRALFVSTLPRTIRIIRRHTRATPRRPSPSDSSDSPLE